MKYLHPGLSEDIGSSFQGSLLPLPPCISVSISCSEICSEVLNLCSAYKAFSSPGIPFSKLLLLLFPQDMTPAISIFMAFGVPLEKPQTVLFCVSSWVQLGCDLLNELYLSWVMNQVDTGWWEGHMQEAPGAHRHWSKFHDTGLTSENKWRSWGIDKLRFKDASAPQRTRQPLGPF